MTTDVDAAPGGSPGRADGFPDDDSPETVDRHSRLARAVTYGVLTVVLLCATAEVEVWPLTAFRLFSDVRTGTQATSQLVAVDADGARTPLLLGPENPVVRTTGHQYRDLAAAAPDRRREMLLAWLAAAHVDAARVETVRLERATRVMDPGTHAWHETSRVLVLEVPL